MLFREPAPGEGPVLAISQPAHAWLSGQMMRAWAAPLAETLLLAAEQHDIAWMDWETAPSFDARTGRPHSFRALGAAVHAPMWAAGVERALAAWGRDVALLISQHGCLIYRRYLDRAHADAADLAAADAFCAAHDARLAAWRDAAGAAGLAADGAFVALADALSLAVCGDLRPPIDLAAPGGGSLHVAPDGAGGFVLNPWPFAPARLELEVPARPLPGAGRCADAAAMRAWLADTPTVAARVALRPR
jgi:hypothetical protein